jgi:bacterioferritin (cytochrome b1)
VPNNPLDGSDDLITALKNILEAEEELFGWAHNQEHYFEHTSWCKLAEIFDKKVDGARERRRPILDRIFDLGGEIEGVETEPVDALEQLLARFERLHMLCKHAYDPAEEADDYVTTKILAENQACLEKHIEKLTAKLAQRKPLGDQLWLEKLT